MLYDILNGALTHWDRDIFADDIFQMCLPSQKLQYFDNKVMFSSQSASSNYPALLQIKAWHRTGGKSISEPKISNIYGLSLSDEYRTQFFQNQKRLLPWSCDILVRAILSDRFDNHWYPPVNPCNRQSIGIMNLILAINDTVEKSHECSGMRCANILLSYVWHGTFKICLKTAKMEILFQFS